MVFLALIILYIFKDEVNAGFLADSPVFSAVGVILLAVLSAVVFYFLSLAGALGWVWWILLFAIFIKAIIKVSSYQKHLAAGLLTSGYIWLFTHSFTGENIFAVISQKVERFLSLSDLGAEFLFGNLALKKHFFPGSDTWPGFGFQFGFSVLPVIIFFAAFMSILYHLGVMQKIIRLMARFMQWTMGTSGAETLSCTANIFVGQTEAPLLIRPFLNDMTLSELLTIMVGGFATIAGGVLAGYIAMGISAGHLIAASVMSAPAALVVAKIIFPEIQLSKTSGEVDLPKDLIESTNLLDAASRGVTDGLKLAVNVGAMLIAFIAIIGFVDSVLSIFDRLIDGNLLKGSYQNYATVSGFTPVVGEYNGIFPGSLKTLFGTILSPLAWLMGVSWQYAGEVGNLLGIKLALTEFVAYGTLAELKNMGAIDEKAIVISTYALCGFANFASIGIQIGGISALVPNRRSDLSKIALKAMFGGAIASWITASIAGILL
ncbi:MAG: NupC/NupG family nucleoside CNT transporter [Candidatus Marinimicrobia bacterium]|nr:NupC/NupG family nucleoside CNT transporter [Candidatus Neomarinimicrobiota bacterium]